MAQQRQASQPKLAMAAMPAHDQLGHALASLGEARHGGPRLATHGHGRSRRQPPGELGHGQLGQAWPSIARLGRPCPALAKLAYLARQAWPRPAWASFGRPWRALAKHVQPWLAMMANDALAMPRRANGCGDRKWFCTGHPWLVAGRHGPLPQKAGPWRSLADGPSLASFEPTCATMASKAGHNRRAQHCLAIANLALPWLAASRWGNPLKS